MLDTCLHTARTILRPFVDDDISAAFRVFGDGKVMRYAAGIPDRSPVETHARLERYMAHQRQHGFSKWAVVHREAGYIGDAGLMVLAETGEVELGYRLAEPFWGRGLASEVAAAWIDHGLGQLGLPRIIAFADPRNRASVRIMQKCGMTFDRVDNICGLDCVVYHARAEPTALAGC